MTSKERIMILIWDTGINRGVHCDCRGQRKWDDVPLMRWIKSTVESQWTKCQVVSLMTLADPFLGSYFTHPHPFSDILNDQFAVLNKCGKRLLLKQYFYGICCSFEQDTSNDTLDIKDTIPPYYVPLSFKYNWIYTESKTYLSLCLIILWSDVSTTY